MVKSASTKTFWVFLLTVWVLGIASSAVAKAVGTPGQNTTESAVPRVNVPKKIAQIHSLSDEGLRHNSLVQFAGTVDSIERDNTLVVRDHTGKITVDVDELPLPVAEGETIIITGRIERDWSGKNIEALQVTIDGKTIRIPTDT